MCNNRSKKNRAASPQHILVINRGSLLDEGIVRLISSKLIPNVATIKFESEDVLVNEIVSRQPEVVVMGQSKSGGVENLYKLLTGFSTLSKLRMIIYHSNDNFVDVFSQQQQNSYFSGDFINLVHGV